MVARPTSETIFASANDGVRLAAECLGEGPPLYAIHGGPANDHRCFARYLDPIARYRRLCLLDQRGCGDSGDASPESYTFDRLALDIEETRLQLGHEKVALLGHSLGGPIALSYALRFPGSVSALILVCAPIRGWKDIVFSPQTWPLWASMIRESMKKHTDWISFAIKYDVADPARAEEVRALLSTPVRYDPARVQKLTLAGAAPFDVKPLLTKGVPVFGIYGRHDIRFLPSGRYLRAAAVRVKTIQSGHMPFVERPDEFHAAVSKYLSSAQEPVPAQL